MHARLAAAAIALFLGPPVALAQSASSPAPLYPDAAERSIRAEPLPPLSGQPFGPAQSPPAVEATPAAVAAPATTPARGAPTAAPADRVFCDQPVSVQVADPSAVAQRYRRFVGIWSDASWSPLLCAALIVGNVTPDGTASIVYVFGPMASGARDAGGILHGTGVVRDGELRFQNSDGSQFVFKPLYADLDGHLTTPRGQSYQAIFKKTP